MPKRNLMLIMGLFAAAIAVVYFARNGQVRPIITPGSPSDAQPLAEAMKQVRDNYRQPVDDRKLMEGAIRGMVAELDPYSHYIPPQDVEQFNDRLLGTSRGLGLRVEIVDGQVVVIGPLMDSPAHHAGIRGGDRIESVDGKPLAGLSLEQVYTLLDGPRQRQADLVVVRGRERRPLAVRRDEWALETVQGLYRDAGGQWVYLVQSAPGVAYFRLREFVRFTPQDLHRILDSLGTLRGVILDLRDNPGGMLDPAVSTANLFLSRGRIVTAIDRSQKPQHHDAHPKATFNDHVPVVVLVNAQTASAAEIVAGSLWANDRACLVGSRTLGKGCVQTPISLGELGQINLTTAEYYLAGGLPITRQPGSDLWGVDPHLQVVLLHEQQVADLRMRAEVLPSPAPATAPALVETLEQKFLRLDTQLAQALALVQDVQEMKTLLRQGAAARAKRLPTTTPAPAGR